MKEQNGGRLLVSDLQAAPILGLSVQTLRNWRCAGRGPAYIRIGERAIRYDVSDLNKFITEGRVDPFRRAGG